MRITRFALVLRGEGGDDENKPLKHFKFNDAIRSRFSLTMTSTSLIGQPQRELKYKIQVEQEFLDLHLLCVYMYISVEILSLRNSICSLETMDSTICRICAA